MHDAPRVQVHQPLRYVPSNLPPASIPANFVGSNVATQVPTLAVLQHQQRAIVGEARALQRRRGSSGSRSVVRLRTAYVHRPCSHSRPPSPAHQERHDIWVSARPQDGHLSPELAEGRRRLLLLRLGLRGILYDLHRHRLRPVAQGFVHLRQQQKQQSVGSRFKNTGHGASTMQGNVE